MAEEAALEPLLFDGDEGQFADTDVEPATAVECEEIATLKDLIGKAEVLAGRFSEDPKLRELVAQVKDLTAKKGARPVIFCRFISTAEAVGEALRAQFKKHTVEVVTGRLTPEDRRARVEAMSDHPNRILVATDCLSEGINLQALFNAVVHYDLNWNPTRHQQRDGRVDRFGQHEDNVWSVMMFGANSIIDGAVIKVITEKMKRIQKETGVVVPVPEDSASVSNALMQAMLLHSSKPRAQGMFDFGDAEAALETQWRDAEENARKSQTRYAQTALKPEEVLPEWRKLRDLLGGPEEVGAPGNGRGSTSPHAFIASRCIRKSALGQVCQLQERPLRRRNADIRLCPLPCLWSPHSIGLLAHRKHWCSHCIAAYA
ncbi:C-terminal helicase domain-containing protein [Alteraurantiacibacter buctensis]|uniref:C-terminal helicase domain-containing protein n=1 Tax=Alteraurantiacibacter buctensis TaxID=1503981 RepID=UPI001F373A5D|nr:C-terminal helicase domain-containing protein [Alteraurantiacibacter buctensis]